MSKVIEAPVDFIESIAEMRLSERTNERLQVLMDRSTDGILSAAERAELESLVDLSESMSLVRGRACLLLGRSLP